MKLKKEDTADGESDRTKEPKEVYIHFTLLHLTMLLAACCLLPSEPASVSLKLVRMESLVVTHFS